MGRLTLIGTLLTASMASQPSEQGPKENGQAISVTLIDVATGKPAKDVWVLLRDTRKKHTLGKSIKTNSQGTAEFHLLEPQPERIGVSFAPDEFGSCSEVEFVTEQILRTGIVGGNRCETEKIKPSANASAGQVVIFGKRVTLWQRILRELP